MRNFRNIGLTAILAIAILALPAIASADGLTWTINNVTFNDGGTASGSFNYDATTNAFSAINVTTTPGTLESGSTYNSLLSPFFNNNYVLALGPDLTTITDFTGSSILGFFFTGGNGLTNLGGIEPVQVLEISCLDSACNNSVTRFDVGGGTVSTPEPATLFLLGAGLIGLALIRRRA